ncbi:type VI secretion system-associated protein TagF [Paracoccus sp. Ld10]|uniref:type VI secretion system-associated protein TagF n=1 Tax=Paracoccus sp. Ld10 TaxID=649158 RepID=UPI00386C4B96
MPAEHRLMSGAAGLYGKHPGFGDFIAAGLPDRVIAALGDWMQAALGQWRDAAGDGWQEAFDATPRISFWIGPALCDRMALRGVWQASRDRSGRRYPLLVLQTGGHPPTADPADKFYAAAGDMLDNLLAAPGFDARDVAGRLATDLPQPPDASTPVWPTFWALNARHVARDLLKEMAAADHAHAAACRSYWWFSAQEGGSGVLACQSWPGPDELAWLMAAGRGPGVERTVIKGDPA